jgi:hypothetical protein
MDLDPEIFGEDSRDSNQVCKLKKLTQGHREAILQALKL